jgi:hypothetical protein
MGYRLPKDVPGISQVLQRFFAALARLQAVMGVVVAGYRAEKWYDVGRLREIACSAKGVLWLSRLSLRFYAPTCYLQHWRELLAPALMPSDVTGISGEEQQDNGLDVWARMEQAGLRQKDLAARLGKTPGFVSKLRSGKKPWPEDLLKKAEEIIASQAVATPQG